MELALPKAAAPPRLGGREELNAADGRGEAVVQPGAAAPGLSPWPW